LPRAAAARSSNAASCASTMGRFSRCRAVVAATKVTSDSASAAVAQRFCCDPGFRV